jgi:hypothetical protein
VPMTSVASAGSGCSGGGPGRRIPVTSASMRATTR